MLISNIRNIDYRLYVLSMECAPRSSGSKRLVLLSTDGEPADIDQRDPQYLRHDAKVDQIERLPALTG